MDRSPRVGERRVPVTQFKAHCLRLLGEIAQHGGKLLITKRGKPLAVVDPAPHAASYGRLKGVVEIVGDVIHLDTAAEWKA